jgi:hypothetical protein
VTKALQMAETTYVKVLWLESEQEEVTGVLVNKWSEKGGEWDRRSLCFHFYPG